jgi:hypothetical protein
MKGVRVRSSSTNAIVTTSQIVNTVVLLLGILWVAFGYYGANEAALFAGLIVTAAGVLNGVMRIIRDVRR